MAVRALRTPIFITLWLIASSSVRAQDPVPFRYADRPITLPVGTLRVDSTLQWVVINGPADDQFGLLAGVAAGFTDSLEIGAQLVPVRFSPNGKYMDPHIYGKYRLAKGQIDVALQVGVSLPASKDTVHPIGPDYLYFTGMAFGPSFYLTGGLPVIIRFAEMFRVTSGAFLDIALINPNDFFQLRVPIEFAIQITPNWFVGPDLALHIASSESAGGVSAPLGFFVGHTFDTHKPIIDWRAGFRSFDIGQGFDVWSLYTGANFYFGL